MNSFYKKSFLLALSFSSILNSALANDPESKMAEAYKSFKEGAYQSVIDKLEKVNGDKKFNATKFYLEALSQSKLQQYDKAAVLFKKAIENGNNAQDIYYELGQCLYATNDLKDSRAAFSKSYQLKYKEITSLYYMANISQILEENLKAKEYYQSLLASKNADMKMKQISEFQLAEVLNAMAEERDKPEVLVQKYVIPQLEKAYALDESSNIATDIKKRKKELMKKYDLDPNIMVNGKELSDRPWNASVGLSSKFDTNLSLATDTPSKKQTQKEAIIYDFDASYNYRFNLSKQWTITPEVKFTKTKHQDQDNTDVFTNDTQTQTLSGSAEYYHKLFNKAANTVYDYEYNRTTRDYRMVHHLDYYSSYHSFGLGEKFTFFSVGDTTLKVKYKSLSNTTSTSNSKTYTLSGNQIVMLPNTHLLVITLNYDKSDVENIQSSTNTTLLRFDYIIPTVFDKYSVNLAYSQTFLDTREQQATRGTEKTYSPSVKVSQKIKDLKISVGYTYTKNSSLDAGSYTYDKNVTSFELKYTF